MRISDWSSDVCSSDLHCSQEKEMHRLISCAAALAVLTLTAAGEPPTRTPMAEAALQKALAGRTPGKPESCVSLSELGSQRIIDRNTILFEGHAIGRAQVRPPVTTAPHVCRLQLENK